MCTNKDGWFHYFGSVTKSPAIPIGVINANQNHFFVCNLQWSVVNCDKDVVLQKHGLAEFTKETPLSFSMCSKLNIRCCLLISN